MKNFETRCLEVIRRIVPDTKIDDNISGWINELDLIEIIMEAELEFNSSIEEGDISPHDFNKVSDLIDWLDDKTLGNAQQYTRKDLMAAAKYGYEYRHSTSFPELSFEDNCENNVKQWIISNLNNSI